MEHPFTFFTSFLPGVSEENLHVVTALFVTGLILLGAIGVYPKFREAARAVLPAKRFGVRALFEIFIEILTTLCDDVIGHGGRKYVPFIGSIFFFILACNIIGLIPGFLPATENWATGAAVATIAFIGFNYYGFKASGLGYLKHFLPPVSIGKRFSPLWFGLILPFIGFSALFASIELLSMVFRPITLSIRLYANIFADHTVLGIFSGLVPYLIPVPFLALGILVSVVQAFIFTLLTVVYISGAVAHEH